MHPLESLTTLRLNRDVVLTIGVFDGVHLGHQHLIGSTVRRARERGALAAVVTFHPHPQLVLSSAIRPAYLTDIDERLARVAELGVDCTIALRFTKELAQLTADDFVAALCRTFRLVELRVGPDFALGRRRQGTIPVLRELGQEAGFEVSVADGWQSGGVTVSSTQIRKYVREGNVVEASRSLGRYYQVSGLVVKGDERGRTIGFPTANLETAAEILLPADGVYAVDALVGGSRLPAVCNIGNRPSFGTLRHTFEVHILDFGGNLYGTHLSVRFVERLRGETRFPDVTALKAQITTDVERARDILGLTLPSR